MQRVRGRFVRAFVRTKEVDKPYMKKKHVHCTPIWAMPRRAAAHGKVPISLQHAMSWVLSGRVKMFAILAVPDTVPRRTNMGLRPRDERRAMIL